MGHSRECQSSPGWGDGVPPPSWEVRAHLEQEEGRGEAAGFPGALSAEIMEDEVEGGLHLADGAHQPSLHPPHSRLLEEMRRGPRESV